MKNQNTRKKRFYRAVERAQVLNLIGVRVEPSGRTLVWLAEAQAMRAEHANRAMHNGTAA